MKIINDYYNKNKFVFLKKYRSSNKIFKNPNFLQVMNYFLKIFYRKIFSIKKEKKWNIAFSNNLIKNINHSKSVLAPQSKDYFLADPFLYKKNKTYFVFAEKYDLNKKLGKIVIFKIKNNSFVELGTAIDEPFHLSFPYVFEYRKKIIFNTR